MTRRRTPVVSDAAEKKRTKSMFRIAVCRVAGEVTKQQPVESRSEGCHHGVHADTEEGPVRTPMERHIALLG